MYKTAFFILLCLMILGAFVHNHSARAEDAPQPFTLSCTNNGGKTIYFSSDLSAKKWALMKANGKIESEVQPVTSENADFIKLKNPGGYFNVNRKSGFMELIKGETRKVDKIPCQKNVQYIPIPADDSSTNKF